MKVAMGYVARKKQDMDVMGWGLGYFNIYIYMHAIYIYIHSHFQCGEPLSVYKRRYESLPYVVYRWVSLEVAAKLAPLRLGFRI